MNLDLADRDIGIGYHHVEGVGDLTELATVVHVVGLHLPLVHDEGDIGCAMQAAIFLGSGRYDIG